MDFVLFEYIRKSTSEPTDCTDHSRDERNNGLHCFVLQKKNIISGWSIRKYFVSFYFEFICFCNDNCDRNFWATSEWLASLVTLWNSCWYVSFEMESVTGLSWMMATWSPWPACTCLSTQFSHAFNSPPTNLTYKHQTNNKILSRSFGLN